MNQRKMVGLITKSATVPIGTATADAMFIGSTSRHVQWAKPRTANGAGPMVSMMSSVTAATLGCTPPR